MKHPAQVIKETLADHHPDPGVPQPVRIIEALRRDGWHLVSTPMFERTDAPPGLAEPRFGSDAHQVTRLSAHVDDVFVTASASLNRYSLLQAPPGYVEHAVRQLGRDFLLVLGHRLGVPGCEDIPERLERRGHL